MRPEYNAVENYESLNTKDALAVQGLYKRFIGWHEQLTRRFDQAKRLNMALSIPAMVPMGNLVDLPLPNQREEEEMARRQALLSQDPFADVEP